MNAIILFCMVCISHSIFGAAGYFVELDKREKETIAMRHHIDELRKIPVTKNDFVVIRTSAKPEFNITGPFYNRVRSSYNQLYQGYNRGELDQAFDILLADKRQEYLAQFFIANILMSATP